MKIRTLLALLCAVVSASAYAQSVDSYYPAGRNAFDAMGQRINGNSTQFGMHLTGSGVTTTGVTNLSGWTPASNYGVRAPATGPTISIGGKFDGTVGGARVPMTAIATASRAGVLSAVGKLIPFINTAVGLYQLVDEISKAGDGSVSPNKRPDGTVDPISPFRMYEKGIEDVTCGRWGGQGSCMKDQTSQCQSLGGTHTYDLINGAIYNNKCAVPGATYYSFPTETVQVPYERDLVGNWALVRPKYEPMTQDLQKLVNAQLDAAKRASLTGVDWSIPVTAPVITAPSSLEPTTEKKTRVYQETGPDGITRTKTETTTVTTARPVTVTGDTVKVTPTATTKTETTTTNPDGSTTTETKTETETTESDAPKADDPDSDLCAKHPEIIACQSGSATDTPLPSVPDLYTQKYPDGLAGVWDGKKQQLTGSSLVGLLSSLMPSVSGGTCPVINLNLDVGVYNFGQHDISPPCEVWTFGKWVIIISALLLARSLVFGG